MQKHDPSIAPRCCPGCSCGSDVDRRGFLGVAAVGGAALGSLSWSMLAAAAESDLPPAPPRRPLVVKPVLTYGTYTPRPQTSWRPWGGIQKQEDADAEVARINGELAKLKQDADYPVEFLPVAAVRDTKELKSMPDVDGADCLLVYAAAGSLAALPSLGKHVVVFIRHKSGPVYLWYEIVSPRFLRQHTDDAAVPSIQADDVVVDRLDELDWRLRSLCGLVNTSGSRILAVGGPSAWAQPKDVVPNLVRQQWKLDIVSYSYDELKKVMADARADQKATALAARRCDAYLQLAGTTLEVPKTALTNAFLLEGIFRKLMAEAGCRAMTINSCMGAIMPVAETTACMALSTLNDDGYLAFCESDFVVIPSGILAGNITGRPTFLNDPTFPHDGMVTLAHCTAPRKMDGKTVEPVRILTHFESDYGAAPKVEMKLGQKVTNILPDFAGKRWVGFLGEVVDNPYMPICRSQIDIKFQCDAAKLADRMPGFHWMMVYGDCMKEVGYALKKIPIQWEVV